MKSCSYTVEQLLPHAPPMVLLDEVIGNGAGKLVAGVTIRSDSPFSGAEGVPAHVAIEYMAQACGALAGIEALEAGIPIRLGLLLGTRNFHATESVYRVGERLVVTVAEVLRDERIGVFDCRTERDSKVVANATLTVFRPAEGEETAALGKAND